MAFGFKPARLRDGSPYNASVSRCYYSTAADLFVGDPVNLSGTAEAVTAIPSVIKATAGTGNAVYGIVVGIEPIRNDLTKTYVPSGTSGYVYVETNPNVVYHATEDAAGGALAITAVGLNINYVAGAGNATFGTSGASIDSSSPLATATLQFRLLGLAQTEGNVLGSDASVWEVTINNSNAAPNTAGA